MKVALNRLKSILKMLNHWKKFLLLSVGGLFGEGIFIQFITWARQYTINGIVWNDFEKFLMGIIIFVISCMMSTLSVMFFDYNALKIPKRMAYDVKKGIIGRILNNVPRNDKELDSSEQLFRVEKDVNEISDIYESIFLCISCLGRTIGALIVGITISWELSVLLMAMGIVNFYIVKAKIEPLYSINREFGQWEEEYFGRLFEFISNHAAIKLMINTIYYGKKKKEMNRKYMNLTESSGKINAKAKMFTSGVYTITTVLMIILGIILINNGKLSIGGLVAFLAIQGTLIDPYRYFEEFMEKYSSVLASYDRVMEIYDAYDDKPVQNEPGEIIIGNAFEVRVRDLEFSYTDEDILLNKTNVSLESGNICYITGESGCGKTTFIKLLMKRLKPISGTIGVKEGSNFHNLSTRDITYVPSKILCINASIGENIAFEKNPDMVRMNKAAKMAGIYDEIMKMPDKYSTLIRDNGKNLSGGQAVRISMARAFYRDAKVMLLDEVFASLDKLTAEALRKSIEEKVKEGSCAFVITHRSDWIPDKAQVLHLGNC